MIQELLSKFSHKNKDNDNLHIEHLGLHKSIAKALGIKSNAQFYLISDRPVDPIGNRAPDAIKHNFLSQRPLFRGVYAEPGIGPVTDMVSDLQIMCNLLGKPGYLCANRKEYNVQPTVSPRNRHQESTR